MDSGRELTPLEKLGVCLLSFLIPVVGIILAVHWWYNFTYCTLAKVVLVCALISIVLMMFLLL